MILNFRIKRLRCILLACGLHNGLPKRFQFLTVPVSLLHGSMEQFFQRAQIRKRRLCQIFFPFANRLVRYANFLAQLALGQLCPFTEQANQLAGCIKFRIDCLTLPFTLKIHERINYFSATRARY